jgi:hypothetical protein
MSHHNSPRGTGPATSRVWPSVAAALIVLLAASVPGAPAGADGATCGLEGEGTALLPYLVEDAEDLALVGVAPCGLSAHYRQDDDIDLDGVAWTPIAGFAGVYDGSGRTISSMALSSMASSFNGFALFASANTTAILRDVHLRGVDVNGPNMFFGVATLVGYLDGGVVERSSAMGSVLGLSDVGGLVGYMEPGSIVRYSWADVDVTAIDFAAGGLVGTGAGTIRDSFARGAVEARRSSDFIDTGGLVGWAGSATYGPGAFEHAYATGRVTTPNKDQDAVGGGGLVGRFGVADDTQSATLLAVESFWDTETAGQAESATSLQTRSTIGARSTAQMKSIGTFRDAGWLIVDGWAPFQPDPSLPNPAVWGISPSINDGYPFLLWEYDTDPTPTVLTTGTGPSYVVGPDGAPPRAVVGTAAWQHSDGSSVPLAASSPAPGRLRYEADGLVLTLTGAAATSVPRGLIADANGEVVCEVCAAVAPGAVIEVWLFSEPRLIAAHLIADLPCQRFTIPVVSPLDGGGPVTAGAHTLQLVLPTASGVQAVNVGVTVGGPVPASVPAGQGSAPMPLALLLAVLVTLRGAARMGRRALSAG